MHHTDLSFVLGTQGFLRAVRKRRKSRRPLGKAAMRKVAKAPQKLEENVLSVHPLLSVRNYFMYT